MRRILCAFICECLFLSRLVGGPAETGDVSAETPSEYVVTSWHIQNGLPSDRVRGVIQTRDGYIWVATFNGIARFDGVRFDRFNDANTPEMRNSLANTLFEDSAGRLWVGSDTGEIVWRDSEGFHPLTVPANWPSSPVDHFAQAADGTLYALDRNGLILVLVNCQCTGVIGETSQRRYSEVTSDHEGRVWAVQYGGNLVRFSGQIETQDSPAPVSRMYRNAVGALQGGVWVRDGAQLRRWHDGRWVENRGIHSWTPQRGVVLHENAAGELWVGTVNAGTFIVSKDGSERRVNLSTGLGNDLVSSILTDEEGNTWIGTDGGGLHLLRHRVLSMVNPPDRWQNRAVLSVAPSLPNGLWVGTEGAGVYHLKDGEFTAVQGPINPTTRDVRAVWQTRSGRLWAGTQGAGLLSSTNAEALTPVRNPVVTTLRLYYAFFEDKKGALWMGTQDGLVKYENGEWSRLGTDLFFSEVRCITQAPDGAIWAGLRGGGLARYQDGRFTQFRGPEGLSYNIIWCLYADNDGTVWIGTPGAGLIRWRNGRFDNFTTRDGLPSDFICNIQADNSGHLWIGSYAGIFQIEKKCLDQRAGGGDEPLSYILLDMDDGLTSLEIAGGNQPSACATADGHLWYATSAGLAEVDPARLQPNRKAPPVQIEQVLVDGRSAVSTGSALGTDARQPRVTVPPGGGPIEIRYTALSYSKAQRCRFRYRLEPMDEKWVDAGERRSVYYSRLPPREYRFHVIACNSDGVWNETGATIGLILRPHVWQTWWFLGSSGLLATGILGITARYATRRRFQLKLERLEQQHAIEKERARIARDMHDELGAKLTRISFQGATALRSLEDRSEAERQVGSMAETARELVASLDEIVWAVDPGNDSLENLANYICRYASALCENGPLACEFSIPPKLPDCRLPTDIRHNIFLAVKEALNNALKHSGGTQVQVNISMRANEFEVLIADNGHGFEVPAPGSRVPDRTGRTGHGLVNLRDRLAAIHGRCELESDAVHGTRVRLVVSLKASQ